MSSRLVPNEPTYDEVPVDIYDQLEDIDNAPYFDEDGDLIYYPYEDDYNEYFSYDDDEYLGAEDDYPYDWVDPYGDT